LLIKFDIKLPEENPFKQVCPIFIHSFAFLLTELCTTALSARCLFLIKPEIKFLEENLFKQVRPVFTHSFNVVVTKKVCTSASQSVFLTNQSRHEIS